MSEELKNASENIDAENDNHIVLEGPKKWATQDSENAYRVISGNVCVYILCIAGGKPGRRILLSQCDEGSVIPSLCVKDNIYQSGWMFYFSSAGIGERAVIEKFNPGDDYSSIKKDFMLKVLGEEGDDFEKKFVAYFNNVIEKEKKVIGGIEKDRIAALNSKQRLIHSVFNKRDIRRYEGNTDSQLYNLMSVYCDYMNIPMCSYRSLVEVYGDDFSPFDIARASHFVARRVSLEKNWYKKYGSAFITYYKDSNDPVLCIHQGSRGYFAYDTVHGYEIRVTEEVAELIEDEGVTIYQNLPSKAISLKDVVKFGFHRVSQRDLTVFCLMYLLVTLLGLLMPFLNKLMYDKLIPLGQDNPIYQIGFVIIACMVGNIFFSLVQNLASFRAVKTMEYNIVAATYGRIFRLPQKFIDEITSTELVNRANSVSGVFTTVVSSGVTAAAGAVLSIFYLNRMFKESKVLAWRGLIMALLSGVVMFIFGRLRVEKEKRKLEYSAKANGKMYHFVTGILKIKVSGIETRSLFEYEKDNVESVRSNISSTRIENIGNVFTTIMSTVYTGFIFYTVIKKKQSLTIGEFAAFNSAYGLFTSAINQLVIFFITNATLVPVLNRIRPIFEQETETTDHATFPGKLSGDVEVAHLDFAYGNEDEFVLKDINMSVKAGEFIGIVGTSGCGKSTFLKCLLGFETPTKGNIFYDGKDITTVDKCELRRQMGVVLQDGQLVVGNIFTNVTMSAPNMEADEALELLKEVGLYKDVEEMPMGIFTSISEGGGTVSGGQKQRILIARAIANNPAILLLDEATSALDNITQQEICENLKNRNITRIMIAHRLSTVVECDRIYVMDRGRIVECGNYKELMEKKGKFYELAKRQRIE